MFENNKNIFNIIKITGNCLILLFLLSCNNDSEDYITNPTKLTITVVDPFGANIPHAFVFFYSSIENWKNESNATIYFTDSNGAVNIENLSDHEYFFTIISECLSNKLGVISSGPLKIGVKNYITTQLSETTHYSFSNMTKDSYYVEVTGNIPFTINGGAEKTLKYSVPVGILNIRILQLTGFEKEPNDKRYVDTVMCGYTYLKIIK